MKRQNTFLKMASLSCTKMAEIDRAVPAEVEEKNNCELYQ